MPDINFNSKIQPCIIFNNCAEEAINAYVNLFPKSGIEMLMYWERQADYQWKDNASFASNKVRFAGFSLCGLNIMAFDSPGFVPTDTISFFVHCRDQAEVDKYYDFFAAEGTAKPCGWVTDKWGVSWQIVPLRFNDMMRDENPKKVKAVLDAMLSMHKFDVAGLEQAYASVD
jgi:predicted 3-demethylubiquinone-9 3-methyltransferase (glyoxalase superfamily)